MLCLVICFKTSYKSHLHWFSFRVVSILFIHIIVLVHTCSQKYTQGLGVPPAVYTAVFGLCYEMESHSACAQLGLVFVILLLLPCKLLGLQGCATVPLHVELCVVTVMYHRP